LVATLLEELWRKQLGAALLVLQLELSLVQPPGLHLAQQLAPLFPD
jgi:hypothetical protein